MKYIIIILMTLGGCATNKQPELKRDLPEGIHELLHIGNNYARKSVTIKDYLPPPSPQGLPKGEV